MALVTCKDCGNQISTEATACPKCGRPAPKATATTRDRNVASAVITVIVLAASVWSFGSLYRACSRSASSPPVPPTVSVVDPTTARIRAAETIWESYENLPPEQRTKDRWQETLATSVVAGSDLVPPHDAAFHQANQALARKHVAPLVNPESRATGPGFTILVPSSDPTRCALWAAQWSKDAGAMRTLGFSKLICGDREWVIP